MKIYIIVLIVLTFTLIGATLMGAFKEEESLFDWTPEDCRVPRYAPYVWVKAVTKTAIVLGITDPNEPGTVTGFSVYYWGLRFGVNSTIERRNRDFGQRTFSARSPYIIKGLKPKFVYCADVTAFNSCGHGPFCISCFENVLTWDTKESSESRNIY
ncbi:uncharacterized protein LOC141849032 [Brevipalpus obovatus]|uniref:uncharacterized protein LOC141849032 n=1 Tax=Brevipalpus obovatus TaxID=246614 RepID=UPI003D9DF12E